MTSANPKRLLQAIARRLLVISSLVMLLGGGATAQELIRLPFPYGPLGLNSMPWLLAKDVGLFEKHGITVDMVYVGASAIIVQSMLSGSFIVAGFGGPAVITNVLRGGDVIQIADSTKRVMGKYLGVSDAELLRQSYLYVTENFVKEPVVPEGAMQSMVQRMAQLNMIAGKLAQSTPLSAYFDNSIAAELKQSGFLDSIWK